MFEVSQNQQPNQEKKSFGKLGIFLIIFAFLCVAGLLYFWVPKIWLKPSKTEIPVAIQKTEKQKVEADVELIKQGYVKSVSGDLKEINQNKDEIIILDDDNQDYKVSVNNKTKFYKIVQTGEEKEIVVDGETIDVSEDKKIEVSIDDLKMGYSVEAMLTKFVKLDKETNFVAKEVIVAEKAKEAEYVEEDENISSETDTNIKVETQDASVEVKDSGATTVETDDASVKTSESGEVKVETPNSSVDTGSLGL